jgi:hypothetical protein
LKNCSKATPLGGLFLREHVFTRHFLFCKEKST